MKNTKKVVLLLLSLVLVVSLLGCGEDENKQSTAEMLQEKISSSNVEPNTNEMVDYIHAFASENATKDEALKKEAIDFILNNKNNFFKDNATMELCMYYGYWMEKAYGDDTDKTVAKLGMDTYQVAKYVYRNIDTPETPDTLENLKQIDDGLKELGYI